MRNDTYIIFKPFRIKNHIINHRQLFRLLAKHLSRYRRIHTISVHRIPHPTPHNPTEPNPPHDPPTRIPGRPFNQPLPPSQTHLRQFHGTLYTACSPRMPSSLFLHAAAPYHLTTIQPSVPHSNEHAASPPPSRLQAPSPPHPLVHAKVPCSYTPPARWWQSRRAASKGAAGLR